MQRNRTLPSWVPDWSAEKTASSLTRDPSLPNGLVPSIYKAAGDSHIVYQVEPTAGLLKLRGAVVDKIVEITADNWEKMERNPDIDVVNIKSLELGKRYHLTSHNEGFFLNPVRDCTWFSGVSGAGTESCWISRL